MGTLSDLFGMEYADDIAKLVGSMATYEKAVGLVSDLEGLAAVRAGLQAASSLRSTSTSN